MILPLLLLVLGADAGYPPTPPPVVNNNYWMGLWLWDGGVVVENWPSVQSVTGSVNVSGTVAATQSGTWTITTTAGSTWDAGVDVLNWPTSYPVTGSFWQSTQPVSGTFWQATQPVSLPTPFAVTVVDGGLNVNNWPGSQAVTGTFWQATQPISGAVSVSNLPATQPVSGTFWQGTQPVSGTVTANQGGAPWAANANVWDAGVEVQNWPAIQTVMQNSSWYGTVSFWDGGVEVENWPASQAVTGTFWQTTQPVSGTFWQATQPVSGTVGLSGYPIPVTVVDGGQVDVQVKNASLAVTGTFWQATQPVSGSFWQSTQPVSGTFWQATQPVSGTFWQTTQPVSQAAVPWSVSVVDGGLNVNNWPATTAVTESGTWNVGLTGYPIPVTVVDGGTVTVSIASGTYPLPVTVVDGGTITVGQGIANATPWLDKLSDGTTAMTMKAASTASVAADTSLIVQINPNQPALTAALLVQGKSATNAAVTNPVIAAAVARADGAAPTAFSAGNQGNVISDTYGRVMVQTFHPNHWSCFLTALTTLASCQAAPGAGLSLYVTDVIATEGGTAGTVTLSAGTGAACVTTNVAFTPAWAMPINGNLTMNFTTPIKTTANTLLCATATQTSTLLVNGFTAP